MSLRRRLGFTLATPVVLFLVGCGTDQPVSQGTYYMIATNIKLPYWQSALAGLNRAASELHVKAEFVGPDNYNPAEEHGEFQRVLNQNPAGILISVADRRLMRGDIDSAIARGVPVFTIDSDAEYSKRLTFIGTDSYKAGTLIGTTVVSTLNGKGNIIVFTMPEQLNLVQRLHGFQDAIAKKAGLKVTRIVDMQGDPRVAFDTAKDILTKSPDKVDSFVCLEAIACAEIADVLSREKTPGKLVVAMDAEPNTLDWIKKGFISAAVAQKPYSMAYVGLHMIASLSQHKPANLDQAWAASPVSPVASLVDTGVTLVNSENVDQFIKETSSASSQ
jgi:ribose transport system substrate-binding protein